MPKRSLQRESMQEQTSSKCAVELTDICYSRKHHAASTHADALSASEWQSLFQPSCAEEEETEKDRREEDTEATSKYETFVNHQSWG